MWMPSAIDVYKRQFYYCENLKTLGHTDDGVLPKGLTTMGVKAFYFCKALEGDLVIPELSLIHICRKNQ